MGWKSTKEVTKEQCLARIFVLLGKATDENLEDILEILEEQDNGCYNYKIIKEYKLKDTGIYGDW